MKKTFMVLSVIVLLLFFVYRDNNNPKSVILDLNKAKKMEAGQLRYVVNFLGIIPAGEALFSNQGLTDYKGVRAYHLSAFTQNLKIYHGLRKVSATLDSYVDAQDSNPIFFSQRLSVSGRPDTYKEILYDQKAGIIEVAGLKRQMPYGTQDPLSAIFNLRKMDFTKNKNFELSLNTNQKNYVLEGTARDMVLSIHGKDYAITVLEGKIHRRDKNNPYHQSKVTMYLLKQDGENIPVLIKVFASGILINAKLTDGS
ncbi:MAG: DUF3108 domain-containing protein [Candidatus Omnitrophota bacterium]|nr:DUF3108 domain-containing protein [Candidatus Omnitrophota bacterium]